MLVDNMHTPANLNWIHSARTHPAVSRGAQHGPLRMFKQSAGVSGQQDRYRDDRRILDAEREDVADRRRVLIQRRAHRR